MIAAAIAALALAGGGKLTADFRVLELVSPSEPGLYRFRVTDELMPAWKQQNRLRVFDAAGAPLSCEMYQSVPMQSIRRTYPLKGDWLSDDRAWSLPQIDRFKFNGVWRFEFPRLADGEEPTYVDFTWHSTLDDPDSVQLADLDDGQWTLPSRLEYKSRAATGGKAMLGLITHKPSGSWPTSVELRFSLASDEIAIESPRLQTSTLRPWAVRGPERPQWFLFEGNGNTPYRVQAGTYVDACSGLGPIRDSTNTDPEWPPEATVNPRPIESPQLGDRMQ